MMLMMISDNNDFGNNDYDKNNRCTTILFKNESEQWGREVNVQWL